MYTPQLRELLAAPARAQEPRDDVWAAGYRSPRLCEANGRRDQRTGTHPSQPFPKIFGLDHMQKGSHIGSNGACLSTVTPGPH